MNKLYFYYAPMNSSKSAQALMAAFNYSERGQKALLVLPKKGERDGDHTLYSRIGISEKCIYMEELTVDMVLKENHDAIIVDEAQFLTKSDIEFLIKIMDEFNIPILCYGLRTDFQDELFEGSLWLMAWADKIQQIKSVCWCGANATKSVRLDKDGNMVTQGNKLLIGGNKDYTSLCGTHYRKKQLKP